MHSLSRLRADEAALTLPAASVAVAVKFWLPFASAPVAYVHAPLLFAVVVPNCVELSNTVIVLFASAVPLRATVLPLTLSPEITGASGVVVSTCGLPWAMPVSDKLAALPAPSLIVAPLRLTAVTIRSGVF